MLAPRFVHEAAPLRPSHVLASVALMWLAGASGALAQAPAAHPPADAPAAAPAVPTDGPAAADPDAARRALPVATFEGGQITVGDLEDHIQAQNPFMRKRYAEHAALVELAKKLARFELLAREAERRGYGNHESVAHAVKQNAVQAFIRAEFDDKRAPETIPQQDVDAYYKAHESEFVQPAMRRASHLRVATADEAKAALKQAQAMDMRAFRQMVKDKSLDEQTKLRGGDLRFFTAEGGAIDPRKGQASVDAALAKAAFGLKEVGDTHPRPIPIEGGFSILKLTGIRPATEHSVADADQIIRQRLWREQRQAAIDARIAALKATHKPVVKGELVTLVKFDKAAPIAKGKGLPEGFPAAPPPPTP